VAHVIVCSGATGLALMPRLGAGSDRHGLVHVLASYEVVVRLLGCAATEVIDSVVVVRDGSETSHDARSTDVLKEAQ
jgi:hypothetical protein